LAKAASRARLGAEVHQRRGSFPQSDHSRARRGDRDVPAGLPVRPDAEHDDQDPHHGARRRALAHPAGKSRPLMRFAPGWILAAMLAATASWAAPSPEDRLSAVFEAIEQHRLELAMERVEALIREHPNFRLAHLVRGDLLLARTRPLETFGNVQKTVPEEKIAGLREEALARMRAQRIRPSGNQVPRLVLQLHEAQKHVLLVDSRISRLYVFANENGRPRLVADYYVTLGKNGVEKTREGDKRTPIGVYHVTGNLPRQKLTDFYGWGAFPINYPNEWDRRLGRNGYGIWLHGTPSAVYARPPRASDGCIVLANPDIEA